MDAWDFVFRADGVHHLQGDEAERCSGYMRELWEAEAAGYGYLPSLPEQMGDRRTDTAKLAGS